MTAFFVSDLKQDLWCSSALAGDTYSTSYDFVIAGHASSSASDALRPFFSLACYADSASE